MSNRGLHFSNLADTVRKIERWRERYHLYEFPKTLDYIEFWKHGIIHVMLKDYLGKSSHQLATLEGFTYGKPSLLEETLVSIVQVTLEEGSIEDGSKDFLQSLTNNINNIRFRLLCGTYSHTGGWLNEKSSHSAKRLPYYVSKIFQREDFLIF